MPKIRVIIETKDGKSTEQVFDLPQNLYTLDSIDEAVLTCSVFGKIKEVLGFGQFSLRGLAAATGEWFLVCLAYNLRLLHVLRFKVLHNTKSPFPGLSTPQNRGRQQRSSNTSKQTSVLQRQKERRGVLSDRLLGGQEPVKLEAPLTNSGRFTPRILGVGKERADGSGATPYPYSP